jgi:glycosyltransferase involved in cell wall biosynthesis
VRDAVSVAAAAVPPPESGALPPGRGPCELAVALLTYNNAATVGAVVEAARAGLDKHFGGVAPALVNADAGSSDATPELVAAAGLRVVTLPHEARAVDRIAVPYHGVPGREAALRAALEAARRLRARALLLLEADVTSVTPEWVERLVRPVWEGQAALVTPVNARHRYDGTLTSLVLAPLVRALFGRRWHQPLGGAFALSARLLGDLLDDPGWPAGLHEGVEVWMLGRASASGLPLGEAHVGPRRAMSRTRAADLPSMVAQTVGAVFAVMGRDEDGWLGRHGSAPVAVFGERVAPGSEPAPVDAERMVRAFEHGLRELASIWEHILAPDTLGDVLSLAPPVAGAFRFPDELWARVVYDFALGYRYRVVHRDHLLRSLVPLYLGRAAAHVLASRADDDARTVARLDAVGATFERLKPYLVERWR